MLFERFARWFPQWQTRTVNTEASPPPHPPKTKPAVKDSPAERNANGGNTRCVSREQLADHCGHMGRTGALAGGSPKPNALHLQKLEEGAAVAADASHVPRSEMREQRRIARMTVLDEAHERQAIDVDRAAIHVVAAKEHRAQLGPGKPYPTVPEVFLYAAVIGLSISIAPTFHDLLVGLDSFLKWVAGGACAVGVGLLIVHGILPSHGHAENPETNE